MRIIKYLVCLSHYTINIWYFYGTYILNYGLIGLNFPNRLPLQIGKVTHNNEFQIFCTHYAPYDNLLNKS